MGDQESFEQFVGDFGDRSWVVLFVQADIDRVTAAYEQQTGRSAVRDLTVATGPHQFPPTGCIAQLRDCGWVIVFHLVGNWDSFDTAAFSQRLDARVLDFAGEDTSGAVDCKLYEPSFGMTRYQTATDSDYEEELYDEMSEYAEEAGMEMSSPQPATGVESYEALFATLEIATVKISLAEDGTVLADAAERERIVRVDRVS
jgi:hypothetical protein